MHGIKSRYVVTVLFFSAAKTDMVDWSDSFFRSRPCDIAPAASAICPSVDAILLFHYRLKVSPLQPCTYVDFAEQHSFTNSTTHKVTNHNAGLNNLLGYLTQLIFINTDNAIISAEYLRHVVNS